MLEYVCACESVYGYFAMLFNLCVNLYICVYAHMCLGVRVRVCMRLCERMYVIMYSYIRFPVYMYGVRVMGMRTLSCVLDLYVSVFTRVCTYTPICVCMGMPIFVSVSVCVFMCVSFTVCPCQC